MALPDCVSGPIGPVIIASITRPFPIATALASTWDVDLLTAFGHSVGHEAEVRGRSLARSWDEYSSGPIGGSELRVFLRRSFPLGTLAAATVDGIQAEGVGATIKHYVANNPETNRVTVDTKVSERALREIYLRGFSCGQILKTLVGNEFLQSGERNNRLRA